MEGSLHLHSWQTCSVGEGEQREGTRSCKCSWFIPALVQWGSSAGSGGVTQLEGPTALLQGWEKDEGSSLHSVEPALERSCVRGCWGLQLGHAGLKAVPVPLVDKRMC